MSPEDQVWLRHLRDAALDVQEFAEGRTLADFEADLQLQRAVLYTLFIIGEAANHLSPSCTQQIPGIPWHAVIGLRHRIAHGYFELDPPRGWQVIQKDVPLLLEQDSPLIGED